MARKELLVIVINLFVNINDSVTVYQPKDNLITSTTRLPFLPHLNLRKFRNPFNHKTKLSDMTFPVFPNLFNVSKPKLPKFPFRISVNNTKATNQTFLPTFPTVYVNDKNATQLADEIIQNFTQLFPPKESIQKFPPVVEYFVQKIQASQSNYIYEDLSRPQTHDKPIYTLSPKDEEFFGLASTQPTVKVSSTTVKLFELITDEAKPELLGCKETTTEKSIPINKNKDESFYSTYELPNIIYSRKSGNNKKTACKNNSIVQVTASSLIEMMESSVPGSYGLPNVIYLRKNITSEPDKISDKISNKLEVESANIDDIPNIIKVKIDRVNITSTDVTNSEKTNTTKATIIIPNLIEKSNPIEAKPGWPNIIYEVEPNITDKINKNGTKFVSYGTHGIPNVVNLRDYRMNGERDVTEGL
ncbi:uncharacterized protein LOC126744064 isoform X1 [Anthonomus grandis grandis]|uniref:uncharacterized protein LOC126744064 isoform X1 n=1 Tax=Anthonomus grandis grandis TaxID=2921223 RepID=UPI0021663586|nr:uncharacterized protein LOC126744064 isoform X1 [Anthonomus grandis grandis]